MIQNLPQCVSLESDWFSKGGVGVDRFLKMLDAVLGVTDQSNEERITRFLFGILLPMLPLWYGVASIISRHSKIIGRRGIADLTGTAAMLAGAAYVCLALLIHVHNIWDEHPWFAGVADAAKGLLLIALGAAMVGVLVAVLV